MVSLQARKRKSTVVIALKRASGWWKEADTLPEYALELRPEFAVGFAGYARYSLRVSDSVRP